MRISLGILATTAMSLSLAVSAQASPIRAGNINVSNLPVSSVAVGAPQVSSFAQSLPSGIQVRNFSTLVPQSFLVTTTDPDDPSNFPTGSLERNGVSLVFSDVVGTAFNSICTGSMISSIHVLTAAHCVDGLVDGSLADPRVRVGGIAGQQFNVEEVAINPLWFDPVVGAPGQGAFGAGDIAVLRLDGYVGADVEQYQLYGGTDEFNVEARRYGLGTQGQGEADNGRFDFQIRTGLNTYEAQLSDLFELFGTAGFPEGQLLYDFDNGLAENNAMPWWFGPEICLDTDAAGDCILAEIEDIPGFFDDLGFGDEESNAGGGDSGGPTFIEENGELFIAGVTSFGFTFCSTFYVDLPDVSCGTFDADGNEITINSSFGEMAGDTRVSTYRDWVIATQATLVPEPSTLAIFGGAFALLGLRRRRATK